MRDKTPTKAFYKPILQALAELGGRAPIKSVFQRVEELMSGQFSTVVLTELPTGGPRWKKTLNFAKKYLADQLLLDSDGETWSITSRGREFLRSERLAPIPQVDDAGTVMYFRKHRDKLLQLVKNWFEREHGRNSVETTTIEAALRKLFQD